MNELKQHHSNGKLALIIFIIAAVVAGIVLYYGVVPRKHEKAKPIVIAGTVLAEPRAMPDFTFTDNHGKSFTQQNLYGHWTMFFIGFTNCGYVCPTTLTELSKMYKTLQQQLPDNQLPQVLFVSVDPERDTQDKLNSYVSAFNPHFIGIRASLPETMTLVQQLHLVAIKVQADDGKKNHYMIDHSSQILMINPQAQLVAYLSFPHPADQLVHDYQQFLGKTTEAQE